MNITEDQLSIWAKPPSETEETKCQNTISRVKDIILKKFDGEVDIFLQGSYKNRTNVKKESDVDIVVRNNSYFFPDTTSLTPADKIRYDIFNKDSDYTFSHFKNDIEQILQQEFGLQFVNRKNKCIRILKNDYRVNADVVPCFVHKRMKDITKVSAEGIELRSDQGEKIYSFPQQHFDNGIAKNNYTSQMYKSIVRILKNVRNNMVDSHSLLLEDMPSFFIESLVWNVPSHLFRVNTYTDSIKNIVTQIWNDMRDADKSMEYAEVCDLRWLFKGGQRNPAKAEQFMLKTWNYLGFS